MKQLIQTFFGRWESDFKVKLIAGITCIYITCIYIKLRCTYLWQFKCESRKKSLEENSIKWNYKTHV